MSADAGLDPSLRLGLLGGPDRATDAARLVRVGGRAPRHVLRPLVRANVEEALHWYEASVRLALAIPRWVAQSLVEASEPLGR